MSGLSGNVYGEMVSTLQVIIQFTKAEQHQFYRGTSCLHYFLIIPLTSGTEQLSTISFYGLSIESNLHCDREYPGSPPSHLVMGSQAGEYGSYI